LLDSACRIQRARELGKIERLVAIGPPCGTGGKDPHPYPPLEGEGEFSQVVEQLTGKTTTSPNSAIA
jgi:hypothetical protein